MEREAKIYVARHAELIGSAIVRKLREKGNSNELNVTSQAQVEEYFNRERPDYVFLSAAKIGGIYVNNTHPAEFIYINLMIECNVIHAAYRHGVKKLLFLGSGCIRPRTP